MIKILGLTSLVMSIFFGASALMAQSNNKIRILAENVDIKLNPKDNIQLKIWENKLPLIIKNRQDIIKVVSKTKDTPLDEVFFTASMKDGDRTIIISSVNQDCSSSSAAPNTRFCTARIVELKDKKIKLLKEEEQFPFSTIREGAYYDKVSNSQILEATFVKYNEQLKQIEITELHTGVEEKIGSLIIE